MIDAVALGRLLAEEVINAIEPVNGSDGPCLYPGKFKPPHKGHFEVAEELASMNYITEVIVIISNKTSPETGNITPEQSLLIWKAYLDALPNPKIKLQLSTGESPIDDAIAIIERNKGVESIYIAGSATEKDDQEYLASLVKTYGNLIKPIKVNEKRGEVSSEYVRNIVMNAPANSPMPDEFKNAYPGKAFNKGATKEIWDILTAGNQPPKQPPVSDKG